jgi:hypothetical protein
MEGKGKFTFNDGNIFSGQFKEGRINGHGTLSTKING